MNWVKEFYNIQNNWFGIYLGPVGEEHHKRAWRVQEFAKLKTRVKVLELGAGGGQTAIALANLGHDVTMIELLSDSCEHARTLKSDLKNGSLRVIEGDFYQVDLAEKFDLVCYFDSFGIGTDHEQQILLKRMASWLKDNGQVIIEVGSTNFWVKAAGFEMDLGAGMRKYEFDSQECRLIDKWWLPENTSDVYYQSLRCYSPVDFKLLLEGTGLKLTDIQTGGTIDFENMEFLENADWDSAMTYYTLLELC